MNTNTLLALSPLMNTLVTMACIVGLIALGIIIVKIFKAIRRDLNEMDDERKAELRDFDER